MTKFNYKKWLTEHRHGKPNINYINEQDDPIQDYDPNAEYQTYYGCSVCPEGAVNDLAPNWDGSTDVDLSGTFACEPMVQFDIPSASIVNNSQNLAGPNPDYTILSISQGEYTGNDPEILAYNYLLHPDSTYFGCSGSGEVAGGGGDTESVTYYGCSVCPEGAVVDEVPENWSIYGSDISGQPMCYPVVSFDIPSSDIQNNDDYAMDPVWLYISDPAYTSEYIGSDENILIYNKLKHENQSLLCSGSGEVAGGGCGNIELSSDSADDYFACPTEFCEIPQVSWFIENIPICEQCFNDPIQNAAIQCCCCPGYEGLPQSAIDYFASYGDGTFDGWGGPNQCDGSTIPASTDTFGGDITGSDTNTTGSTGGMPSPQGTPKPYPDKFPQKDRKKQIDKDLKKSLQEFKYSIKRTINNLKRKK